MNLPGMGHSPIHPEKENAEIESRTKTSCSVEEARSITWTVVQEISTRRKKKTSLASLVASFHPVAIFHENQTTAMTP